MTGPMTPNSGAITESIERSLQNCSLSGSSNSRDKSNTTGGGHRSTIAESGENNISHDFPNNTLELNSQIRLPYYWEQCLDLKSGEVYYINWRTGMKSRDDPRMMMMMMNPETNINVGYRGGGGFTQEIQEQGYDSEGSYYRNEEEEEESSPSSSTTTTTSRSEQCIPPIPTHLLNRGVGLCDQGESENESSSSNNDINYIIKGGERRVGGGEEVLVVAGCKGCFMYFMVPKQVEDCPKCFGQLLHFDRSDN